MLPVDSFDYPVQHTPYAAEEEDKDVKPEAMHDRSLLGRTLVLQRSPNYAIL